MATKNRKAKLVPQAENFFGDLPSEQIETTFSGHTIVRMRKYMKERALLKEQELIRLAVGFFLQNQGY